MRIPVYTAEGQVTREAPGQQIRARISPQQVAQAELAKSAPAKELLSQAGKYAETRYKIETENNLNEALLDAQEALRERRDELEKSDNYHNVLDGDDPVWTRETEDLKQGLLEKVGRDKYALQQFNARFNQLELQNRFSLRDGIDRRIEIAAAQNRARLLQNAEDRVANSLDLSEVSLILQEVFNDTENLAAIGAGNPKVLNEQQYKFLYNAAFRSLEKNADESESGVSFVDEIRSALRDGLSEEDQAALDAAGKGEAYGTGEGRISTPQTAYVYGLMKMLNPSDQAELLKSVGATQTYLEGPDLAQQSAQILAKSNADEALSSMSVYMDELSNGQTLSSAVIENLRDDLVGYFPSLNAKDQQKVLDAFTDLENLNYFQISFGKRSNALNIDQAIEGLKEGLEGREGIDTKFEQKTIQFAEKYKANLMSAMQPGGDAIAFAQTTKMDGVNIEPVDLSAAAVSNGTSGLARRLTAGKKIQALNGLDYVPLLSKGEAQEVISQMDQVGGADAVFYLDQVTSGLTQASAGILIEELSRAGLSPEYVQAMYVDDAKVRSDIIALKDVDMKTIKDGLPSIQKTGATGVTQTINNSNALQQYRSAYVAGGNEAAAFAQFEQQRALAEKLAYSYVAKGESVDNAVEKAMGSIFPDEVVVGRNQNFLVPKTFKPSNIESATEGLLQNNILSRFDFVPLSDPRYGFLENVDISEASLRTTGVWLNNGTGDGLVLHFDLNGAHIPVYLQGENALFEVKFSTLDQLDLNKLASSDIGLTPNNLLDYSTGFKPVTIETKGAGTAPVASEFPGLDPSLTNVRE